MQVRFGDRTILRFPDYRSRNAYEIRMTQKLHWDSDALIRSHFIQKSNPTDINFQLESAPTELEHISKGSV